jgi:hypothetical protein
MDEKQHHRLNPDQNYQHRQPSASPLLPTAKTSGVRHHTDTDVDTTANADMHLHQGGRPIRRVRPTIVVFALIIVAYFVLSGSVTKPAARGSASWRFGRYKNGRLDVTDIRDTGKEDGLVIDTPTPGQQRPMEEEEDAGEDVSQYVSGLVPFEAHIMSKCIDAKDCLRELILPTMTRAYDKVNFTLSFLGTPTENDGVDCKHGPEECLGNILELCAAELYPDPKISLGFTMCLTRDYHDIPQRELVEDCALEHAVDFAALNECATKDMGAHGMDLLRKSVRRTSQAGITKSCTVRLNNEIYCVRDDRKWVDCPHGASVNDLVVAIEKLYRSGA